jgi:hypothetical protein
MGAKLEMKRTALTGGYSFDRPDSAWRKSRIAARLLYRKLEGPLKSRDQKLAEQLRDDPEVTNRLIQQALYYLGGRSRKHEVDKRLVEWGG